MKVLLTGAGGLLGQDVWRLFSARHELVAIGRTQPVHVPTAQWRPCDLSDAERTYAVVTRENPDIVIHAAAYNLVDEAETHREEAYRGNSIATRNLALACQRFDTTLLHVSTDYVFDGEHSPAQGYREFDAVHPLSVYGESKRWAEMHVQDLLNKFFIVRTSWLFGPGRATWVDKIVEAAHENRPISAVSDMTSAPTYTPHLAQGLLQLAESHHYGIYHLTNTGFCTRVDLAEEVLRLHKQTGYKGLKKTRQADLKLPARRPVFSGLDNLAWRLEGYAPLRPWQEALVEHFQHSKVAL